MAGKTIEPTRSVLKCLCLAFALFVEGMAMATPQTPTDGSRLTEVRKLTEIRPYKKNPRINDHAVDAVARSIKQFGFRQPIVVDAKGVIIVGHTRWKAAVQLGMENVPVHVAGDLTAKQARAYRIADNQTGSIADWDFELLPIELADLRDGGIDLDLLGFGAEELARLFCGDAGVADGMVDPDDIPAPPDKATTKRGDIWLLGDHRLMCGDSGSPDDLDRLLAGQSVHLVNTDPPYNVKVEPRSNNAIAAGLGSGGPQHHQKFDAARRPGSKKPTQKKLRAKDRPLANDFVTDEKFEQLLAAWFGNIARVLKPGGSFYIWGGYANCANYPPAFKAANLYFSQSIIWVKEHPVLTRKDFMGNHEWCFYGWREGGGHKFYAPANKPDVWEFRRSEGVAATGIGRGVRLEADDGSRLDVLPPAGDDKKRPTVPVGKDGLAVYGLDNATDVWFVKKISPQKMVHLTEKPAALAVRAVQYSSLPGERVLDLFGGSGSTLIGCEQTGRRAMLMEMDPLYCDVIVERYEKFTGKKAKRQK